MGIPNLPVRTLTSLHTAFRTLEGDGFEVRRAIPANDFEAVGPFIFLDHFGPIGVKPGEAKGASAHPHAGIETLTLLLDGSSQHKEQPGQHEQHASRRGAVAAPAGA
jgi:redox-sensitive bicupin YhaK (pirin superfamily)